MHADSGGPELPHDASGPTSLVLYTCPHCEGHFPAESFVEGGPDAPMFSDRCHTCRYEEHAQMQALLAAQVVDADAAALAAGSGPQMLQYVGDGGGDGPPADAACATMRCDKCGVTRGQNPGQDASSSTCLGCLGKGCGVPLIATPEPKVGGPKEQDAAPLAPHPLSGCEAHHADTKTCMHCGTTKELAVFRGSKNKTDRLQNRCKECEVALGRGAKRDKNGPLVVRVEQKLCRRCSEVKASDLFFHSKLSLDGLCTYCKACQKELNKQARAKRPDVLRPQVQEKECRHCGLVKPADQYFKSRMNTDGLYSYCRSCATLLNSASKKRRRAQLRSDRGAGAAPAAPRHIQNSQQRSSEGAAGLHATAPALLGSSFPGYSGGGLVLPAGLYPTSAPPAAGTLAEPLHGQYRAQPPHGGGMLQEYALIQAMTLAAGLDPSDPDATSQIQAALAMQLAMAVAASGSHSAVAAAGGHARPTPERGGELG
uniref:Stc1 domain-containing protein n=1 Tax=Auxenochlorella protothecoides TaxID=3075 RepID=A0A1D1ZPN7_AUXPR